MRTETAFLALNRGLVSRLGLSRSDVKRTSLAAQTYNNYIPRVLGSMMLRPGMQYLGNSQGNKRAFHIPFVFSTDDAAILEMTDQTSSSTLRVWINDVLISRPSVSTAVTNGTFSQYSNTCTISNASPAIVTYTGADNFANNDPVTFTTTGALPTGLTVGSTYYVKNVNTGANTFEVSSTPGGTSINTSSAGSGVHTVYAYYFITGWTDNDESGCTSAWLSGNLSLTGNGTSASIRDQTVTVAGGDVNVEHALRIVIVRGPVSLRVGSTSGGDEYINETQLETGTHSLSFTPTGNFYIRLLSRLNRVVIVDSCTVEASGNMEISMPYTLSNLQSLRYEQSGDLVFLACNGVQQKCIERRGARSWSFVDYKTDDGPFLVENTTPTTISASAINGNITLTASTPLFRQGHTGALFKHESVGQSVSSNITAENTFSNTIRVTGVGADRTFTIVVDDQPDAQAITNAVNNGAGLIRITCVAHGGSTGQSWVIAGVGGTVEANGTWTITRITADTFDLQGSAFVNAYTAGGTATGPRAATTTLQRSLTSSTGPWSDVVGKTWTADTTETYADGLDNQIAWYRIGVKTGEFISGTVAVSLSIAIGSITGIVRITGVNSSTLATAEVLTDLGTTTATDVWFEGEWSDYRGWPTAVLLYDGRLWWAGGDKIIGSVSDSYYSFDDSVEGDSGPINRSIGSGPVDDIKWLMAIGRMIVGSEGTEFSVRASSLDEPLTPSNFNIKTASKQGSYNVGALGIGSRGVYVQRGGTRLFEIRFNPEIYEYDSYNLCALVPEIGLPTITKIVFQTQPDTRIHCVRSDGTVALLTFDTNENVMCWSTVSTDGNIEDAVVLPSDDGDQDDKVYYSVARTINGSTVRFLEKWAQESECVGGTLNKQADSFVVCGSGGTTISGLGHLEGESVVCWANGKDLGTYTVSSSSITVSEVVASNSGIVGLPYTAQWKSAKLSSASGSVLGALKNVDHIGVILADTHYQGLEYGPDFVNLDPLPLMENGVQVASNTVHTEFDSDPIIFQGTWDTDSRVCLQSVAPKPCTILSLVVEYTAEK